MSCCRTQRAPRGRISIENLRRGVCALLMGMVVATMAPMAAHADTVLKYDPKGDAAYPIDIRQALYRNGLESASVKLFVPALQRRGSARFFIGVPNSDFGFMAQVQVAYDGSLIKRFTFESDAGGRPVPCRFDVTWSVTQEFIRFVVPQSCIRRLESKYAYMGATTGGRYGDAAPPAPHLLRS